MQNKHNYSWFFDYYSHYSAIEISCLIYLKTFINKSLPVFKEIVIIFLFCS